MPPATVTDVMDASFSYARVLHVALLLLSLVGLDACSHFQSVKRTGKLQRYEFTQPQMGVPFRIVLFAPSAATAERAASAAFDRIKQLNSIMSDYETDSELNELSRTSGQHRAVHVSKDLWFVLERSEQLAELSNGAFDITVGPYVSLWRRARRMKQL